MVAFSRDGTRLAAGCGDGTVWLWNPATRRRVATLRVTSAQYGVTGVAFSPDGKLLVTGDSLGAVRAWNPATGQPVGAPIQTGALNPIFVVVFSRDGKLLASGGLDGAVRVWQASIFTHTYAALCADAGPPTRQEWNDYAPGETQPKVCG
jgi:WD40 repeat protein